MKIGNSRVICLVVFLGFYVELFNYVYVCFFVEMRKLLFFGLVILLVLWFRVDDDEGEKKKDKESIGIVIGIDLGIIYLW